MPKKVYDRHGVVSPSQTAAVGILASKARRQTSMYALVLEDESYI